MSKRASNPVDTASIEAADELAAPLDLILTGSALGMAERMLPNTSWSRFVLSLARQPGTVASRTATQGRELVAIAWGRSDVAPAKGDKRFADGAWSGNLSGLCLIYLDDSPGYS